MESRFRREINNCRDQEEIDSGEDGGKLDRRMLR